MKYYYIDENYNLLYYCDDNNDFWQRFGECKECGKCCIALHPENAGENGMCKFLKDDKCSLHSINKPIHCRMSPIHPDTHNHIPECGYVWRKIKLYRKKWRRKLK